jgi:aminopeptidase-like protein
LYRRTGGENPKEREHAMLWILNLSDGSKSLLDIAEKSGISFDVISAVAVELETAELLQEV